MSREPLLEPDPRRAGARREAGERDRMRALQALNVAWREAQADASLAYCHWRRSRDRTAYAIYRAAQDRADSAQDAVSDQHAAVPPREPRPPWP